MHGRLTKARFYAIEDILDRPKCASRRT